MMDTSDIRVLKRLVEDQIKLINTHRLRFLVDSYVLDFFSENLWEKLPSSWQTDLKDMEPPDVALYLLKKFCDCDETGNDRQVLPLSLLCFRASCQYLSLSRKQESLSEVCKCYDDPVAQSVTKLSHDFRRHVKIKKQHEIENLGEVIKSQANHLGCTHTVDVGAGLGHLSRFLSLGHNLKAICIEAQGCHGSKGAKYHQEVVDSLGKKSSRINDYVPQHITHEITTETSPKDFMKIVKESLVEEDQSKKHENNNYVSSKQTTDEVVEFSLIGLHPCGDLSTTMLRVFVDSPEIRGLICAPCCYMRLTQRQPKSHSACSGRMRDRDKICKAGLSAELLGYPMSEYVRNLDSHILGFNASELACHSMEEYYQKLIGNDPQLLRCHCYRAVLELIISKKWPDHCKKGVRINRKKLRLEKFSEYAEVALQRLNLNDSFNQDLDKEYESQLVKWRSVVVFYTLKLLLAPVIESLLLCDRLLFLAESGIPARVVPLFDPKQSPRNFVIIAEKK